MGVHPPQFLRLQLRTAQFTPGPFLCKRTIDDRGQSFPCGPPVGRASCSQPREVRIARFSNATIQKRDVRQSNSTIRRHGRELAHRVHSARLANLVRCRARSGPRSSRTNSSSICEEYAPWFQVPLPCIQPSHWWKALIFALPRPCSPRRRNPVRPRQRGLRQVNKLSGSSNSSPCTRQKERSIGAALIP